MQKYSKLVGFIILIMSLLVVGSVIAQDDDTDDIFDLDGDGVNFDFPDVDPFDTNTYVRFLHLAPEVGDVDIYVNGATPDGLAGVGFEALGEWIALEPGAYNIQVTAAGDDIDNAVVNVENFQLPIGQWLTVAAVVDADGNPTVATAVEDFSEPLPGVTNITFLNALGNGEAASFYRDGIPFIVNLGATVPETNTFSYAIPVDTSTYTFSTNRSADNMALAATEQELDLMEWSSYLIAVYNGADGEPVMFVDETPRYESAILREWLPEDGTVYDALEYNEALNPYARALDVAGLVEAWEGEGPFTVFIPAGFLADEIILVADGDAEILARILSAHVYEGAALYSQDLIDLDSLVMSNGNEIPVIVEGNAIFVGGAQVIDVNIPATNGVIHVLGYVIDPTLDQEDYDLFDDAVNLEASADTEVMEDLGEAVEDMDDEDGEEESGD